MATFVKMQKFSENVARGVHDFGNNAISLYLPNQLPDVVNDAVKADVPEIAIGNGYAGPIDMSSSLAIARTGAITTVTISADVSITATGGAIAQFQYAMLMDDTSTDDQLIGYWASPAPVDLALNQIFIVDYAASLASFQ